MKKAILLVFVAVMVSGVLFAGGGSQSDGLTIKKGTLQVGMEIGYPPMEYFGSDGKTPIGFDVEMAKAIAAKMGLKVQFVDTAWDGIFAGVNAGKYDCIMSSVTINPARQAAHNFSKPYVSNTLAMVLLKDSKVTARTPEACVGLDVAYQDETTSEHYMRELEAKGLKFNLREYEKVMYCFDELKLGRVDVIITDLLVAYEYIAQENSPFIIVWRSSEPEQFGICMKKGNNALTAAIDEALDALFEDGTMLKISNNIFGMDLVTSARK
jgi:polar amino acid transport system substrate-binding protein